MHASELSARERWFGPIGFLVVAGVGVLWLCGVGLGDGAWWFQGVASGVTLLIRGGGLALAFWLAALGYGRVLSWVAVLAGCRDAWWLQPALGLAALAWLSHGLGVLGVWGFGIGLAAAWGVLGVGWCLLGHQVVLGGLRPERWPAVSGWAMLCGPGVAVLGVASLNAPGVLWESEALGYDVLSYHLQLPKEWTLAGMSVVPLEHNVYSYLPSYLEAVFAHLAALVGGGDRMTDFGGAVVVACQMVHALCAVAAALVVGRLCWRILDDAGVDRGWKLAGAWCAGGALLSVPWVVVVGSMAYNEMALCACYGAGLLLVLGLSRGDFTGGGCAVEGGLACSCRRGLLVGVLGGVLMGGAVSFKPTAAYSAAPVVGLALALVVPMRRWVWVGVGGVLAGAVMVLPWLVRNAVLGGGNPVFPFLSGVFGSAHWSGEQVARYAAAHGPEGTLLDRVGLLVGRERGLLHVQWSVLPFVVVVSAAGLAWWREVRVGWVVLVGGLVVGVVTWLLIGHQQSRFLLPMVVPGAALFGVGVGGLCAKVGGGMGGVGWVGGRGVGFVCGLVVLGMGLRSVVLFLGQGDRAPGALVGTPNLMLVFPADVLTGQGVREQIDSLPALERAFVLGTTESASLWAHFEIGGDELLYLLGDSTPFYFAAPVLYHSTWDASPLGEAVRAWPDDPHAWVRALRGRGVTHVLVNAKELHRLVDEDGWYDPDVTLKWMVALTGVLGDPVRVWPEQARAVFRLPEVLGVNNDE